MPLTTGQIADSLDPIFVDVYHNTDREHPLMMEALFKVSNTDLKTLKKSSMTGLGLVPRKTEANPATPDQIYQGYDTTWTQLFYSQEVIVSREALFFDRHGSMKALPAAMKRAVNATIETMGANHFNRHITGGYTGGDGLVLCHNSHTTTQSSATFDNLGSAGSLTHTTLADLRLLMRKMKNEREIPMQMSADIFLYPLDLEEKALMITGDKYKTGTSNWDINIFNGAGLKHMAHPYVSVATAYWLISKEHQMEWIWSARPEFNRDKHVSAQRAMWYSYFAAVSKFSGFRGIVGNNGA